VAEKSKEKGKQNFLAGALTLALAGIICRLLGIAFRIPLANIVGNFGMGLYQMVFPVYALLLIVSSAGIPVAISKLIAKKEAGQNEKYTPTQILINAILLLGIIGFVLGSALFVFANQVASLQGNDGVGKIYMAIAPAIFFVCLISAFRGYFQGQSNMVPTAISQVTEQLVKVSVGMTLALILLKHSIVWAVFGAILAVTVSEVIALVVLIFIYLRHRTKRKKVRDEIPERLFRFSLMWLILKKSFPITLLASIFPLILVFDSMIVINMLRSGGATTQVATQLYGISSGTVHTLINMPAILGVAIGTAVVPMTAALVSKRNTEELKQKCALAIKLIFFIAVFFAAFYVAFAREIIILLYERAFAGNSDQLVIATHLLKIESAVILLMGISQVFTSILQGAGRSNFPLVALLIGGAAKIGFQFALIGTIGIYAVSIGNVICFGIAFVLNTIFVAKFIGIKPRISPRVWRALLLLGIYGGVLVALVLFVPGGKFWVLGSGFVSFGLYVFFIWMLGIFKTKKRLRV